MGKNKKLVLILIAVILSLLLFLIPTYFLLKKISTGVVDNAAKIIKNTPEVESKVVVSQAEVWTSAFSTEEIYQTKELTHLKIQVNINLSHVDPIKSYTIKNIKVEGYQKGKVEVIKPGHISNTLPGYNYIWGPMDEELKSADIKDSGKVISFDVVDSPQYYDEVSKTWGAIPTWGIIIKDLGEFNYTKILDRDNVYDSAYVMKYAGVEPSEINVSISCDVEMVFESGEKWTKRFTTELDGERVIENGNYTVQFTY